MKTALLRLSRSAACLVLAGALLAGCSMLPAASPRKDPAATEQTLYDATALQDGRLRLLYGSQSTVVLCGGTVLHEGRSDENIALLPDTLTGEARYYWVSQADSSLPSGRRSAVYDAAGTPVQTFEQEYSPSLTGDFLLLSSMSYLEFGADHAIQPGECRVLDLRTGEEIPVPENAYQCVVVGDQFAFTCYDRPDTLAEGEYDEALYQHVRTVLQDRAGTVLREEARCTAQSFAGSSTASDWLMLDFYGTEEAYQPLSALLYNPATGEELEGFDQVCGSGTASFRNEDGSYRLVDLESTAESETLCTFDHSISYYVPGAAICWQSDGTFRYQFHDLTTGEVKDVYNVDASDTQLAVYTTDGTLRLYDRTTGALLTDLTVEPLPGQDTAQIWVVGGDYVLLMLYPAGNRNEPDIRLYNADGLVREIDDISPSADGYINFSPLLAANGHAYFRYGYEAPNNTTLYDVLDETGTVVVKGLSTCYSYYSTSFNALPEGAFVARRGFYQGWMAPDGSWLYCRSIFADTDEAGFNYFL